MITHRISEEKTAEKWSNRFLFVSFEEFLVSNMIRNKLKLIAVPMINRWSSAKLLTNDESEKRNADKTERQ